MLRILLAAALLAAPAFAQDYPGDDQDSYPSADDQAPPPPDQGPTLDDFQNDSELSWNGEWIDVPDYGRVWRPTRVSDDWQPYEFGRWAWTNAGWAWVSDEPFGWAVYHYGRWAFTDAGWVWIPGRVWAPAWVAWRWGDGYAGWCPLGPRGYVVEQPIRWVYVPQQHFLDPVRRHVVPIPQRAGIPAPIRGRGPRAAPPVQVVQRVTGQAVRPLAVTDAPEPHAAQASGGSVGFYRPRTAPIPRAAPQQRPMYFGGVPGPRYGGQPRPSGQQQPRPAQGAARPAQGAPRPAPAQQQPKPHAAPSNSGRAAEKER